ncbi:MAG TPA: DUF1843 domain-containing protein [Pyrinomonadaceae bacterium]|jgi:hypothetical protein|nr:DUF1843 domain-containing protein [Pyrinomonadaceae bacterium]
MPTRAGTKTTKKAAKKPPRRVRPLYGRPIDRAISSGDIGEMRRVAAEARKYVSSVQTALKALDRKIKG